VSTVPASGALRRRPQQRRSQETVEAILDTASSLVATAGPDALTTTAVADGAGIAVGSLYQYFDDAQGIADAIVERHLSSFGQLVEDTVAGESFATADDAACALVAAVVAYYRSEPAFRGVWFSPTFGSRYRGIRGTSEHTLVDTMRSLLVSQGLLDADDPGLDVSILVRWTVSDALLDLAFRLDSNGDDRVLARLDHLLRLHSWSE
jgi:AcrR family transcriptional regulator